MPSVPDDLPLFDVELPTNDEPVPTGDQPIADWQVTTIRNAFDARGLTSMAERQAAIEVQLGRPVASLRSLTQSEAFSVLAGLGRSPGSPPGRQPSSWDDREDSTWIDRL